MNSKEFSLIIENLYREKKLSYIDGIVHYCEQNNIDTGTVHNLISKPLKEKIKIEAEKLNYLPKTAGVLPV